jgi:peptidoglycan/LPS O-acetylase OafA/YrhL
VPRVQSALKLEEGDHAMSDQRSTRANNFDFLRLTLAVLVIYSHSYPLGAGSEANEPLRRLTHGQVTFGAVAVDLFFIMSGYLIAASAERSHGLLDFLKKRVSRIYPAFVLCAVLMAIIVLPLSGGHFAAISSFAKFGDFCLETLRLREFHVAAAFTRNSYPGVLNGSVWSIQYEFWCYIGVAILTASGLLAKRTWTLALWIASIVISVAFQTQGWIFGGKLAGVLLGSPQLWARLLPMYLSGVVFYLFRDHVRFKGWQAALSATVLIAASSLPFGWTVVFPLAGAYLVFYIAFASWIPLHRTGRFGDFSYGVYLYAFPIEQLLMQSFGHKVSPWLLFACATPLTLVAAIVSWYAVERRFLRPVRRKENVPAEAISSIAHRHTPEFAQALAVSSGRADS